MLFAFSNLIEKHLLGVSLISNSVLITSGSAEFTPFENETKLNIKLRAKKKVPIFFNFTIIKNSKFLDENLDVLFGKKTS